LPILKKYQKTLLLTDHILSFDYDDDMDSHVLFQHGFSYPYKNTAITYGKSAVDKWEKKEYSEMREGLIHELCHSITDPLYSKATDRYVTKDCLRDERERLTDHIANVIVLNNI
jgi:hypothetical protein